MNEMHITYWLKQALKHERMAATLTAKYKKTGEVRWLNQALGNTKCATAIRNTATAIRSNCP
jgi:hypothetical protein